MARSLNVSLGTNDYEWRKAALDFLADEVVTNDEAGQRGTKLSILVQMLATAATANLSETARLMRAVKAVAMEPFQERGEPDGAPSVAVRDLLMDVADGDAFVIDIDDYEHLVVAPWLAARLAEVQALDLDDTTLEDWLSALLDQLGAAFRKRRADDNAAQGREGE